MKYMKRILSLFFVAVFSFSALFTLSACGNKNIDNNNQSQSQETDYSKASSFEELRTMAFDDVSRTIESLETQYKSLTTKINTIELYCSKTNEVKSFYDTIVFETENICINMLEASLGYAEYIMSSKVETENKYDALDYIYEDIYNDALDLIDEKIYNDLIDNMSDFYWEGIIEDAYENDLISYEKYSEIDEQEYEWISNTETNVYEAITDAEKYIDEFITNLENALIDDDLNTANEKIRDFKQIIKSLKNNR